MRVAGTALADQLVAYLQFRADGRSSTRLFVSEYPREVLEVACESLVERAESVGPDEVDLGAGLRLAIALIQSPAEIAGERLIVARGYQVGVSPDFPVALRNRRGNVLVACPPELIDLCHESIKTNSFQHFSRNRRFGSDLQLFRQIGRRITDDEDLSKRYADVLRAVYRRERDRRGASGEKSVFDRIERMVESAGETGEPPDWRILGLLPQLQLENSLVGDVETSSRRITSAVLKNLEFQSSLTEGISREQHKYLRGKFAETEGFDSLRAFISARSFRLDLDDMQWRVEWPRDLPIEALGGAARVTGSIRISSLRLRGDGEVLGMPVVTESLEVTWGVRGPQEPYLAESSSMGSRRRR